mmetsp:Transcript_88004/g.247316  ORF Transcript_88004/g.247316 Transcript_88004/m.247316 type:complete len:218 (+) Transcript_88004:682-1335(+)
MPTYVTLMRGSCFSSLVMPSKWSLPTMPTTRLCVFRAPRSAWARIRSRSGTLGPSLLKSDSAGLNILSAFVRLEAVRRSASPKQMVPPRSPNSGSSGLSSRCRANSSTAAPNSWLRAASAPIFFQPGVPSSQTRSSWNFLTRSTEVSVEKISLGALVMTISWYSCSGMVSLCKLSSPSRRSISKQSGRCSLTVSTTNSVDARDRWLVPTKVNWPPPL